MLEDYDMELDRVSQEITARKAKLVCIQLPDGLKPYADRIASDIEANTKAAVVIWAASCFGSCDIPMLDKLKVDLLVQWGHSEWKSRS